jgi:hypothetical protein
MEKRAVWGRTQILRFFCYFVLFCVFAPLLASSSNWEVINASVSSLASSIVENGKIPLVHSAFVEQEI